MHLKQFQTYLVQYFNVFVRFEVSDSAAAGFVAAGFVAADSAAADSAAAGFVAAGFVAAGFVVAAMLSSLA